MCGRQFETADGQGWEGDRGAFVSAISYKADYRAVQDQLHVIDATARDKKCKSPENSGSTSAVR